MRGIDRAQTPPAPQEDAQLALAAKSGDGAALDRLLERYAPFVRRRTRVYARRALEAVRRALEGLEAGLTPDAVLTDAEEALEALGELTGRTAKEEIVSRIFSRFCVGK